MTRSNHLTAILGAFFVTMLWSSSWVLIKIGLRDIGPLIFAGTRYFLAALILSFGLIFSKNYKNEVISLNSRWWLYLLIYGIMYYSITQAAQFIGLFYLPTITVSFLLNLTSVLVLIIGILTIKEIPSKRQSILIIISIFGVLLFFIPIKLPSDQIFGIIIVSVGVVANAISSVLGRFLNQSKEVSAYVITTISMLTGSIILLGFAISVEGLPDISLNVLFLIIWLAIVNTAIAFLIWNYTLQELKAIESSIINSTMLPQITFLAIIFFDESLIVKEWLGLILIFVTGVLISLVRKDSTEELQTVQPNIPE